LVDFLYQAIRLLAGSKKSKIINSFAKNYFSDLEKKNPGKLYPFLPFSVQQNILKKIQILKICALKFA